MFLGRSKRTNKKTMNEAALIKTDAQKIALNLISEYGVINYSTKGYYNKIINNSRDSLEYSLITVNKMLAVMSTGSYSKQLYTQVKIELESLKQ